MSDQCSSIPTFSVSSQSDYVIQGQVNGANLNVLVDTGAASTVLSREAWGRLGEKPELAKTEKRLIGVQGIPLDLHGVAKVDLSLGGQVFPIEVTVAGSLTTDLILGRDFLKAQRCVIQMGENQDVLLMGERDLAIPLTDKESEVVSPTTISVVLDSTIQIPAHSEIEVMGRIPVSATTGTWMVEGRKQHSPVMVARAVVKPNKEEVPLRLLNWRDLPVSVPKGTCVADMEILPDHPVENVAAIQEQEHNVPRSVQDQLWEIVERTESPLTLQQKQQLYAVILEYHDVFAFEPGDRGQTKIVQHGIDTGDSRPIRQQVRRIPPIQREEAKKLLKEMLTEKVIRPSSSPWASPIVLVKKKDGSIRFCVDYRKVNGVTRKDAYPLPRVDDTLDTLAGAKWFSTLDLVSGYWQVEVKPEDREKTAFCTPEGLFEFNVMPFGLCNAPATFQRLMDLVLAGVQWTSCLVYIDDVIITGKAFEEHLKNLVEVLKRLRGAGLKLKPRKCNLCSLQVGFLGHIVSQEGVQTDPAKTATVAEWPQPTNKKEVQQFLGLANYYRRFVKDFATIAKPLHRLTEKTAKFTWASDCQAAFESLRNKLITAPILAFPDYSREFTLDTDASDTGIGAVLSQVQEDGTERVIAYASRVLTRPERRYCVTRRELLAVVIFTQHFRPYLLGRHFLLRTDHGSLTWMSNFRQPEGQLARWLEKLQEFDFKIVHRPGKRHQNADALSRRPCSQCGREDHNQGVIAAGSEVPTSRSEWTSAEMRTLQVEDGPINLLLQAVEKGEMPEPDIARGQGPEAQRLVQIWRKLVVEDGVLKRKYDNCNGLVWSQLVLPRTRRDEVLQELHAGALEGHLGTEKTLGKVKERFYWPGMRQDVAIWCETCETCATRKSRPAKNRAPLQTVKVGFPMQVVAVDILGPLVESEAGNSYILVAGDYFTKWMEAYPIPNQEAITVAEKLVDEMFCRFSLPDQLHSDQGKQFESTLLREICKLLNIKKTRTTPYHPQCDGLVERFNRTLLSMLATTTKNDPFNWEGRLRKVCFAYNSSVHASTGQTPFFLMFGRQAKLPIDLMYPTGSSESMPVTQYALQLKEGLEDAYRLVREKLGASHQRQKDHYDRRVHGKPYEVGDLVWLHSTVIPRGGSRKLHHPWTGPFRILECVSESDYKIKGLRGKKKTSIVHFNRLKPCVPGTRFADGEVPAEPSQNENLSPRTPLQQQHTFGEDLEIVEETDETLLPPAVGPGELPPEPPSPPPLPQSRYPQRHHQPPARYADEFGTNS